MTTPPGSDVTPPHSGVDDDAAIAKLFADTSRDLSALVRNEIELAKTELKFSVRAGGMAIGLFVGAAFLVLLSIVMISIALALFLNWLYFGLATSFLIVFLLYVLIAALLAFIGVKKVKQVRAPERAIHQAQETKNILKRG